MAFVFHDLLPRVGASFISSASYVLKGISLFILICFGYIQQTFGQCDDLTNAIQSSYHASIAKTSTGFVIWGQEAAPNGTGDQLSPTDLTTANGYAYTGTPLFAGAGGRNQFLLLTTTALYVWGDSEDEHSVVPEAVTSGNSFQIVDDITDAGNSDDNGLPPGVVSGDITAMEVGDAMVGLLTNSGEVWIMGNHNGRGSWGYGDGSGAVAADNDWHLVELSTGGNPTLTGVTQLEVSNNAAFAYVPGSGFYTWGENTFLGDGSAETDRSRATLMTNPLSSGEPVMIQMTADSEFNNAAVPLDVSYFVLDPDGTIHSMGAGAEGQLGRNSTADATTWVKVLNPLGTGDLMNVTMISSNSSHETYATVGAITSDGTLYHWGDNEDDMMSTALSELQLLPKIPGGFTQGVDVAVFVEMGGHTSVYINETVEKYCYVGHKIGGSMGDGIVTAEFVPEYDCDNTGEIPDLCIPAIAINATDDCVIPVFVNTATVISVLDNDLGVLDTSSLTANPPNTGILAPTNGTITTIDNINGTITYTPNNDYTGVDTFEYIICDTATLAICDTATVCIEVSDCNAGPTEKIISGRVFNDVNANGTNDSEAGIQSVDVHIYEDINQDGLVDGGDSLLTTIATDVNGNYSYIVVPVTIEVEDQFTTESFSNNDGPDNWIAAWVESDPDGAPGPGGDYVSISGGELDFHFIFNDSESASRNVDLTGALTATLSFDWRTVGLDAGESISIQMSSNGTTFTTIATLIGSQTGSFSQDISTYISNNTTVRFISEGANWSDGEHTFFDNVNITAQNDPTHFVMATDTTSYPVEFILTTDNVETAIINTAGNCDSGNDFGASSCTDTMVSVSDTICQGETVMVGSSVYSTTGIHVDTLNRVEGCDSIVTLNLTVNPVSATVVDSTICTGESVTIGSSTYNTSGTFVDSLVNTFDCDSVVTLNLTVIISPEINLYYYTRPTTCGGSDANIRIRSMVAGESYSLVINGGLPATIMADNAGSFTITDLSAGIYSILVSTIPDGCVSNTLMITVQNPVLPGSAGINCDE